VRNHAVKRPLRKLNHTRGDNIRMDLRDICYAWVGWIHLGSNRDQGQNLVNMITYISDSIKWWESVEWLSNYWILKMASAVSSN
jgi:hypothetical protein